MIKQYGYKLAILGCVSSCLLNVAQAEVVLAGDPPHEDDDVVFQSVPNVSNFACVADGSDVTSNVDYVLQNNLPATVSLFGIELIQQSDDDSGVTASLSGSCISEDSDVNGGSGTIDPWGTCTLTVEFIPPDCAGTTGPLAGTIDQSLYIGVDTQQGELTLDITGEVNVLGAAGQFALLGGFYDDPQVTTINYPVTNQDGYANSVAVGSVANLPEITGTPDKPDTTGFSIYDGAAYYQDSGNTAVNTAETNFEQAYSALIQVLTNNAVSFNPPASSTFGGHAPVPNCTWDSSLDDGDAVTPGYYCLQAKNNGNFVDVTLSGTVYLEGSGNFYFFIDPFNKHCQDDSGNPGNPKMCDLSVESTLRFEYDKGASPENVYWITTGNIAGTFSPTTTVPNLPTAADFSQVELANGAILDGTVLAGAQINVLSATSVPVYYGYSSIVADDTGNRATVVNGSLWAPMGISTGSSEGTSIALSGSTVNAADYVTAESVAEQRAARDEELAVK